ncbi:MAG: HEAT repeat domain-containing protein [Rhodospirillales bacterium]
MSIITNRQIRFRCAIGIGPEEAAAACTEEKVVKNLATGFAWQRSLVERLIVVMLLFASLIIIDCDDRAELLVRQLGANDPSMRARASEELVTMGPAAVNPLIAALLDSNLVVREEAAATLDRIDSEWPKSDAARTRVPAFIAALGDKNGDIRKAAARSLGKIGDARAVEPLTATLQDDDWNVRSAAAEALADIGSPAVSLLIATLRNRDPQVRKAAAETLGKIVDARAAEPLIAALRDDDWDVQSTAAQALGKIGSPAVELLIAALRNKEWRVRLLATKVLGMIGDARVVGPLIAILRSADGQVRSAAVEALGKIGAFAVSPLIAALRDKDWEVRSAAAQALREIRDTRAVEPLIATLRDAHGEVRRATAQALGEAGNTRAVGPLITTLQDTDGEVRSAAVEALGAVGDARAVSPLITTLRDADGEVRSAAAQALGRIGDTRAGGPLIAAMEDWQVGPSAALALHKLGWTARDRDDEIHLLIAEREANALRSRWPETRRVILKDVKSGRYRTIENALLAAIGLGNEDILPDLIAALERHGDKSMAEAYLNCGHSTLDKAARDWAAEHGYFSSFGGGYAPVGWGRM